MSQTYSCSICKSTFKNSRSLYSHKYKYHPKPSVEKHEENNTVSSKYNSNINPDIFRIQADETQKDDKTAMKRYQSDEEPKFKKAKTNEFISNTDRDIRRSERMRKMEKDIMDRKMKLEKRWDEIVSDLGLRGQGGINHYKNILQTKELNIDEKEKYKTLYIEHAEKAFEDCLLMKHLFEVDNYNAIRFKIKELCNAAFMISKGILGRVLTTEEKYLLTDLLNASLFEAKDLLNDNYAILKTIYLEIPDYETVRITVKNMRKDLAEQSLDEYLNKETAYYSENDEEIGNDNSYSRKEQIAEDTASEDDWNGENKSETDDSTAYQSAEEDSDGGNEDDEI